MKRFLALFLTMAMVLTIFSVMPVIASGGLEVVIDHDNSTATPTAIDIYEYTSGGGAWTYSGVMGAGHVGTTGSQSTVVLGAWAMWKPQANVLSDGTYEVWVFNTRRAGAWDERVQYDVFNTVQGVNLDNRYYVNQKTVNNAIDSSWVKLCTTQFSGTGDEYVKLTRVTDISGIYTQADRVKFVPVTSLQTNANLGSLILQANVNGTIVPLNINQEISQTTYEYTARIPKLINGVLPQNLTINVASASSTATIDIDNGTSTTGYTTKDFVTNFGQNKISIDITSQDGAITNTYNLSIMQEGDAVIVDDKLNASQFAKFGGGWTETAAISVYDPPEVRALDNNLDHHWWTVSPDAYATFTPDLSISGEGTYEAYIWGSVHTSAGQPRLPSVDIESTHKGVVEKSNGVVMDTVPIKWSYIGTYNFGADGNDSIKVSRTPIYTQQLRVSTIKLIKVPNNSSSNLLSAINLKTTPLKVISASDFISNSYSIELPKTLTNLSFIISPINSQAQITVNGEAVSAFTDIVRPLIIGANVFDIAITADGSTKTYTLNATRLGEQVNIAPDSTGVADGYSEGGTGWSKSSLAIGEGNGTNTRYTAVTGSWAKWSPNITVAGYYRVTLWNPVNSTPDGDPSALLEIKANGKVLNTTIDWKSAPSRWVDFGTFYFDATSDPLNRDQYIKLTKNTTATALNFRVDAASFTEANVAENDSTIQKLMFDNVVLTGNQIDGYKHICSDMKQTLGINAITYNKDAIIKINNVTLDGYQNYNMPIKAGINVLNISVNVGAETTSYLLTVVNPVIINESDIEVIKSPEWLSSGTVKGYKDSGSFYCGDSIGAKTIKYPINADGTKKVYGKTDVWAYKVIYPQDITDAKADPAITYNIKEGSNISTATLNASEGTSGWVKLGTYNFDGKTDGSEYVELYRSPVNTKTTRADAVMFISDASFVVDYFGALKDGTPQSYASGGSFTGNIKAYNMSSTPLPITLIFAKYNKYTNELIDTKILNSSVVKEIGLNNIETSPIVLADGDEELYKLQLFVFEDLVNIKPVLPKVVIE